MENENIMDSEYDSPIDSQSDSVSEGIDEVSTSDNNNVLSSSDDDCSSEIVLDEIGSSDDVNTSYDVIESDNNEIVEEPKSTVIQVVPYGDDSDSYDVYELDIDSLNQFTQSYVEQSLAVTPSSNDYYSFLGSDVTEYFSGIMANYPLNEYKAYHLRHWVYNSQYSSYYDDYYFLYYNYPSDECVQLYKGYNSSQYVVTVGNAEILDSSITYGSEVGWSDLRGGVNYVSWLSSLCFLGGVLVLYIVHAIFRHLKS